ncbi:ATP-binding protein, partial [Candidatus Gribaldobacteria bacterium]|nr:ATP-binding protein [Candidatus Gribaldobacteria bacterium]
MNKTKAKEIILEQKREAENVLKDKAIIKREVEAKIDRSLKDNLVKVIIGVRRSGKSILAHRLLQNKTYGYLNFDDERLLGIKTNDLNSLLEILNEITPQANYLLLDEIQNITGWELFANRLKRNGYNLVITGSNSKLLSSELATHLTGRHFEIELYPLSFKEFLLYQGKTFSQDDFYLTNKRAEIKKYLNEYLLLGGFPELFKVQMKEQYLRDLHNKIINRDIVERHNIRYVKTLKEISLFLLSNFGSKITYHKIKNVFDLKSVHTVKKYINYLESAYLISELAPFSFKIKEQIKKPRKVYGIDLGLIRAVSANFSPNTGRALENLVFLEFKKRKQDIYFYANQKDKEV